MARYNQLPKYPLVPGGVTNDIPLDLISDGFIIEGTETITANNVFTTTDTPEEGSQLLTIYYRGVATYSGGIVQVFGTNLTQDEARNLCKIECYFNGVDWDVYVTTRYSNTGYVRNPQVATDAAIAVNKLETLTASRIPQISASGIIEPSATNSSFLALLGALTEAAADYNKVAQFTGTTVNLDRVAGGSWTAAELQFLAGVTSNLQTQLNAKANTADFSGILEIRSFSVTIPSASVLDIFSTPVALVPAQGANTIIVPISIQGQMIYGTTPYATDGEIDIYCGGTKQVWGFPADDGFLFGTVSRIVNGFAASSNSVTDTQYVANQPLTIKTVGSNPTAGDSTLVIFGTYLVLTV
jgi:hypothetical protein